MNMIKGVRCFEFACAITAVAGWAIAQDDMSGWEESTPAVDQLVITTTSLPDGSTEQAYRQKIEATGGVRPYAWDISRGVAPAGLVIDPATGVISGAPSVPGKYKFFCRVKDASGRKDLQQFVMSIIEPEPERYSCDYKGGCVPDPDGAYEDPDCGNACVSNQSQPDLQAAYRILQQVAATHSMQACPPWEFIDEAVRRLRMTSSRWGYHKYPRNKDFFVMSGDRIAWYKGPGEPQSGSNQLFCYDIIQDFCEKNPKLRYPLLVPSREFNYTDMWIYPR